MGVDDFAANMYYAYLFQDSLTQQEAMRTQIATLPEAQEDEILHKKSQLDYLEAIFQLQLTLAEDPEAES